MLSFKMVLRKFQFAYYKIGILKLIYLPDSNSILLEFQTPLIAQLACFCMFLHNHTIRTHLTFSTCKN